ncbi:hypothetical protein H920_12739 [Fukomys damarensis]|uniref:Uncharacterized protein n=1 Tax=Fukomys damarensis TaxID=885580 RepID=A0A091DSR0_FUKDA|nr:hypothetical protein H920_12739 [Fukomys damarensis]
MQTVNKPCKSFTSFGPVFPAHPLRCVKASGSCDRSRALLRCLAVRMGHQRRPSDFVLCGSSSPPRIFSERTGLCFPRSSSSLSSALADSIYLTGTRRPLMGCTCEPKVPSEHRDLAPVQPLLSVASRPGSVLPAPLLPRCPHSELPAILSPHSTRSRVSPSKSEPLDGPVVMVNALGHHTAGVPDTFPTSTLRRARLCECAGQKQKLGFNDSCAKHSDDKKNKEGERPGESRSRRCPGTAAHGRGGRGDEGEAPATPAGLMDWKPGDSGVTLSLWHCRGVLSFCLCCEIFSERIRHLGPNRAEASVWVGPLGVH